MKTQRAEVGVFTTCETCGWSEVHSIARKPSGFFGGRTVTDYRAMARVHAGNLGHDVAFEVRDMTVYKGEPPSVRSEDLVDYSTSKYENKLAEKAHALVLDGGQDDSIYSGETVAFDLVTVEEGRVVLRYDEQGFVWIEWSGSEAEWTVNGARHWAYLEGEYASKEEE